MDSFPLNDDDFRTVIDIETGASKHICPLASIRWFRCQVRPPIGALLVVLNPRESALDIAGDADIVPRRIALTPEHVHEPFADAFHVLVRSTALTNNDSREVWAEVARKCYRVRSFCGGRKGSNAAGI